MRASSSTRPCSSNNFTSAKVRKANATFTFTVDDLVKDGYTYEPNLNNKTSETIVVP